MEYGEALQLIGGLSKPSKMPWWSWSISAKDCITGSKLAQHDGTVCSGCYALKGNYRFSNVVRAQERRMAALEHPQFVEAFAIVLKNLHAKTRKLRADGRVENRFRWLDSGDLQSVEMLRQINDVAVLTPEIDHWLPTREIKIVTTYLAKYGEFAPNLTVRISMPKVGKVPRRRPIDGLTIALVGCDNTPGVHDCQALAEQGNQCLDCDTCWRRESDVNYPLH